MKDIHLQFQDDLRMFEGSMSYDRLTIVMSSYRPASDEIG
jgi:hypothetical protein